MSRLSSTSSLILTVASLLSASAPSPAQGAGGTAGDGGRSQEPLPASLDALFPPSAPAPVFLLKKLEMAESMTGIMVDLMEGDLGNVRTDYEAFRTRYVEVRELVPEWTTRFPLEPIDELGHALEEGAQPRIMAALQRAGEACAQCHVSELPRVQQKYHWRDFRAINVQDPLSQEKVPFTGFMHALDAGLVGVSHNVRQGQIENARKSYQAFAARFDALSKTCFECHDTERRYYVDEDVRVMIAKVGQALDAPAPDPQALASLSQGIGMESCMKCHLVHLPAAMAHVQASRAAE